MKTLLISLGIAAAVSVAAVGLMADEHDEEHETHEHGYFGGADQDAPAHRGDGYESGSAFRSDPGHALYEAECGDCHLAYPPSMLPPASWRAMMASLDDHFGDNAELDAATAERIAGFLTVNAAGKVRGEHSERSWRATKERTPPLRITQTDYFRGQHHEIPDNMVADNPGVVSFSRCAACHQGAEQGIFDEHGVRIPGYGRWDD